MTFWERSVSRWSVHTRQDALDTRKHGRGLQVDLLVHACTVVYGEETDAYEKPHQECRTISSIVADLHAVRLVLDPEGIQTV